MTSGGATGTEWWKVLEGGVGEEGAERGAGEADRDKGSERRGREKEGRGRQSR